MMTTSDRFDLVAAAKATRDARRLDIDDLLIEEIIDLEIVSTDPATAEREILVAIERAVARGIGDDDAVRGT